MISVAVAVHNGAKFLAETLESVLAQSFNDFEVIVVNDGSTDSTSNILARYAAIDPRMVIIHQEKRGVGASRNRAIEAARGELLAWIDADDRMLSDRLERQLRFLRGHPEACVVCSYCHLINAFGKRIGKSETSVDVDRGRAELNPKRFLDIVQSTVLVRKQDVVEVGGYREDLIYAEDRDLWGRLVTAGKMVLCQPEFLVEYRLHSGSITGMRAFRNDTTVRSIDLNVVRRLRGEQELSKDDLTNWFSTLPAWQRFNDQRRFYARFHYNKATRYYAEKRLLPFLLMLSIGTLLAPIVLLRRIAAKLI